MKQSEGLQKIITGTYAYRLLAEALRRWLADKKFDIITFIRQHADDLFTPARLPWIRYNDVRGTDYVMMVVTACSFRGQPSFFWTNIMTEVQAAPAAPAAPAHAAQGRSTLTKRAQS